MVKAVVQEFYNHPKYGVQIFDIDSKILPENLDRLADFSVADSLLIAEPILEHPKCKYHKMKQELYNFVSDCVARILQAVWGGNGKFIISGILVAYVTYKILINAFRKRRAHQAQVKEFVDLIIETVESSGLNDKPVNHIRDQLIGIFWDFKGQKSDFRT